MKDKMLTIRCGEYYITNNEQKKWSKNLYEASFFPTTFYPYLLECIETVKNHYQTPKGKIEIISIKDYK